MSRIMTDENLLTWEVYPSGGRFGLPDDPKIIFHCLSDPSRRPRYIQHEGGDNAEAAQVVMSMEEEALQELLRTSRELT